MRAHFLLFVGLGIAFGCSSGSSGGASGGTGSAAGSGAAMCQSLCDWKVRCSKVDTNCSEQCNQELSRNEAKLSSAYASMFQSCFSGLACTGDDDTCIANFAAADPAFPNIPEITACNDKRAECSKAPSGGDAGTGTQPTTTFSDDYCLSIAALSQEARAQANACLSQPCAGIRDCLIQAGAFNY